MTQYFFTSDEHYGHDRSFIVQARGFTCIEEHDETLIKNHNSVVKDEDIVIHAGDFCLIKKKEIVYTKYVRRLNGEHIFLVGSHDYWLKSKQFGVGYHGQIWEKRIGKNYLVVCHYCMRSWPRSHYNSWHLYGHHHGRLPPIGKSWDCGVDNNDLHPIPFWMVRNIMDKRPDNPALKKKPIYN